MASSTSSRTAPIDAKTMQRIQDIFDSDEFYSTLPDKEFIEIIDQFRVMEDYLRGLIDTKLSPTYQAVYNHILRIVGKLTELKMAHIEGKVTNAAMPWAQQFLGKYEIIETVKNAISTTFKVVIAPSILDSKKFKRSLESVGASMGISLSPHYALIFAAIHTAYPLSNEWLAWIPSPTLKKDQKIKVAPSKFIQLTERPLTSLQALKQEDAEKWMAKINGLAGFNKAVSIRHKNGAWFLDINFPDRLVKKLKQMHLKQSDLNRETKSGNLNKMLSCLVADYESISKSSPVQRIEFSTAETIHIEQKNISKETKSENSDNSLNSLVDYELLYKSSPIQRVGFWPAATIYDQVQKEARERVLADFDSCPRSLLS